MKNSFLDLCKLLKRILSQLKATLLKMVTLFTLVITFDGDFLVKKISLNCCY